MREHGGHVNGAVNVLLACIGAKAALELMSAAHTGGRAASGAAPPL